MKIQQTISIFLLLCALVLGLAACGGTNTSTTGSDTSLPATDTPIPTLPPDVIVSLIDTKIVSTLTSFQPGVPYRFIVQNRGKKHHQFVILSTTLNVTAMTPGQLQQAALTYVADIAPGKVQIVDLTFPASAVGGSYQMASYMKADIQAGVKLPITVIAQ